MLYEVITLVFAECIKGSANPHDFLVFTSCGGVFALIRRTAPAADH